MGEEVLVVEAGVYNKNITLTNALQFHHALNKADYVLLLWLFNLVKQGYIGNI